MILEGKKINFLGDSITEGAGTSGKAACFHQVLARAEKTAVCRNYGIGGTRIARQTAKSEPERWDLDFIRRAAEMDDDADAVVVFGGTNDFGHGDAKFGTFTDTDVHTFYGALHRLILDLLQKYPQALIAFMTPLHRADERPHDGKPALSAYAAAIKEVCAYYALPVLDLYATSGIQPAVPLLRERYAPDGLHPNDAGHRLIAARAAGFLKTL